MPYTCCAPRCFNNSSKGYALMRFPKEEQHQKMWSDAIFGKNASKRSLENLRLCEVHFDQSDLLVVGRRKEIKKGAIPTRFCQCSSDEFCNKSQTSKRKKKGTHMRNVKTKLDSENSNQHIEHSYSFLQSKTQKRENTLVHYVKTRLDNHICQAGNTSEHPCTSIRNVACPTINHTTENTAQLSKKQVRMINHYHNCPFTTLPLSNNEIKKRCSTEKNDMSNSENTHIYLSSDVSSIKRAVRKFKKENEMLRNVRNVMELILQNKFKFY